MDLNSIVSIGLNILTGLGGLTLFATIVVRLTPSKTDDEFVGKIAGYWLTLIRYLPTLGINPQTQKLEDALNEALSKDQPPIPPQS